MEGNFPQALAEGQFDILVCHKEQEDPLFQLENMLDPVIYTQPFAPNKNGFIFKFHMYALADTTCSMDLVLFKLQNTEEQQESERSKMTVEMKQRLVIFEVFEDDQIIFEAKGINSGHLIHMKIQDSRKYRLVARYCLVEFPEAQHPSEETQNVFWKLQVVSSETICFVSDTDKEDKEEAIRQTWEQAQPGRAEMAKANRIRYLAQQKQESELTEEEKALTQMTLNDRRKKYKQFVQVGGQQKETNTKKKEEKKTGKKNEVVEDPQETERPLEGVPTPKMENHQNEEIKEFIKHIEGPRIQMFPPGTDPRLRSQCEKSSLRETIYTQHEDQCAKLREQIEKRTGQQEVRINEEEIIQSAQQNRKEFKSKINDFKEKRNQYRSKISARTEKADKLTALLKNENADIQDLADAIEQAKQHQCKEVQIKNAEKALFNLRCKDIQTQIETNIEEENYESIQENLKLMKEMKLKVDKELIEQAHNAILIGQAKGIANQMRDAIKANNIELLKNLYKATDEEMLSRMDEKVVAEVKNKLKVS